MSDEDFTPANVGVIDLKSGTRIYVNTDESEYQKVEGKSIDNVILNESEYMSVINDEIDGKIKLKTWVCKVCSLDNQGVICSECHKMYNQADPDCFLKE